MFGSVTTYYIPIYAIISTVNLYKHKFTVRMRACWRIINIYYSVCPI